MLRRRYFSDYDNEGEVMYYGEIRNSYDDIIIDYGKDINIGGKYVFDYEAIRNFLLGPTSGFFVRFRMGSAHDLIDCGLTTSGKSWDLLIEGTTYSLGLRGDIASGEHVIITIERTGSELCNASVEIGGKKTVIKNVSLSSFNVWSVWAGMTFGKVKVTRY